MKTWERILNLSVLLLFAVGLVFAGPVRPENGRPGGGIRPVPPVRPVQPISPIRPGHGNIIKRDIRRSYRSGGMLPVLALPGIGPEFRGERVQAVILVASTMEGTGRAELLINDRSVGLRERVPRDTSSINFFPERGFDVIGRDIRTMQIRLRGNFYVESLAVRFAPDFDGFNRPDFEEFVGEYVYDSRVFQVRKILDIGPSFRGRRVKWVKIRARAERGRGDAVLLVNGRREVMPHRIGPEVRDLILSIDPSNNTIESYIRSLQIEVKGNGRIYVESIGIKFVDYYRP